MVWLQVITQNRDTERLADRGPERELEPGVQDDIRLEGDGQLVSSLCVGGLGGFELGRGLVGLQRLDRLY